MSKHRKIVLVVDDDTAMLKSVRRLLQQHDYELILFSSAEDFKNHTDFDRAACVILDINLPDGSGTELRHRLKADGVSVPVIYMTGNEDPAVREAALNSGCIAFLTKPFSARSLIEPLSSTASAGRILKRIHHPAESRMLPVLHLDPAIEPAAAVDAVAVLRDQPLQPHQAGVAEQVRADLALLEWRQVDAVDPPRQQPRQVGLAHRSAAACGDPRRRSPACRRRRTRPRHRACGSAGR